jgi:hypothetical protein
LADSKGSQETFDLSYPVPFIDGFISHNWRVPRFEKNNAIALCYNRWPAAACAGVFGSILFIFQATEVIPHSRLWDPLKNDWEEWSQWQTWFVVPVWMWFQVVMREFTHPLGWHRPRVFLDKICIHQVDPDMKRRGIESLGAYLHESQQICIVCNEIYLTSLWTVFELGTLLLLRSSKCVLLYPTPVGKNFCFTLVFLYAVMCYVFNLNTFYQHLFPPVLSTLVLVFFCCYFRPFYYSHVSTTYNNEAIIHITGFFFRV